MILCRYIDIVAGLAVSNEGHIVAVDSVSPTVFVISEDGDLVHWFDCSDHMREPSDIAISGTKNSLLFFAYKSRNIVVSNVFIQSFTFLYSQVPISMCVISKAIVLPFLDKTEHLNIVLEMKKSPAFQTALIFRTLVTF